MVSTTAAGRAATSSSTGTISHTSSVDLNAPQSASNVTPVASDSSEEDEKAPDTATTERRRWSGKASPPPSELEKQPTKSSLTAPQDQYEYNPGLRRFEGKHREKWWQVWRPKDLPAPPPLTFDDSQSSPLASANAFSQLYFQWMTPLMILGYQRPLEATDLYKLPDAMSSEKLAGALQINWERRVKEAEEYNTKLENGETQPGWKLKATWALQSALKRQGGATVQEREKAWRSPPPPAPPPASSPTSTSSAAPALRSGHKKPSLVWAMNDAVGRKLWIGLCFKIVGDAAQITSPLVLKAIIQYTQRRYAASATGAEAPNVGKGIGLAFALFFMQLLASVCQHQFFWQSMSVGVESRAALITSIFNRAMRMNGKARSSGKLVNHISTDCSRIDFASAWFTIIFAAPIQIIVCLIILLTQIGPSALVGFGLFVIAAPLQTYTMKCLFKVRRASMKWTDQRAKSIQEVLGGMRIVKSFSHESRFLKKIRDIRNHELVNIRKLLVIRAANNAVAFSLPVLAAVVAFVVYSATGHDLNPAKIFPALTLFQLLRMPLLFLPLCLSATTDALNAFERLYSVFTAEQLDDAFDYDDAGKDALVLRDAGFRWETVEADVVPQAKGGPPGTDAKAGGVKGALKDRAKNMFRKGAPAAATAPASLPAPVTASASPKSTQQGTGDVPLYKQVEAEHAAGVAGDNADATLTEVKLEPTAGDQIGLVHPDDGVADGRKDNSATPRDGQVSGIGAASALVRAASGVAEQTSAAATSAVQDVQEPFSMQHLNLRIARGELVAVVGPVGSGKSSLLQACIGEMRKTAGSVIWGNERVAYCSQSAWIQNATVRNNVLFGQPFDEERYWDAIRLAELEADLAILPAGDMTEIGEKGVNLSGGQKQRVNIARALYYDAPIVCLDDPLSAVDAHVGKALFKNAILGLREKGTTVILVTHALHFLPEVDRIITMDDGRIAEMGTYQRLSTANGPFQKLIEEFGGEQEKDEEEKKADEGEAVEQTSQELADAKAKKRLGLSGAKGDKKSGALMEAEERNTGSISGHVYYSYLKFGNGAVMVPICLVALALMQATNILNSYWLVWWQEDHFNQTQGFYMGIFAALGVSMTIFTFIVGTAMGYLSFYACRRLHHEAISRVMYAPMAWLDVTPIGRIMNRFSKDVDVVDNQLADAVRMAANTMASVLGAIILITILTHYFIIAVAAVLVFYFFGALFYRSSAREVKRLDAILRSSLYSHFSETLSGLATIRAYRETPTFISENVKRMNIENRAYLTSAANQRWLGVRLDLLGAVLVLIVAILTTASSNPLTGGNSGVALTYMMTVSQAFSWMTRQVAEVENDTASVERLLHYAETLEQEAAQSREDNPVRESWPEEGSIEFEDIWLSYRPGLPSVLKGISFKVGSGQKVGIVGRTGAGKSSLLTALLRLVELSRGKVVIDGVDVSQIGLQDLRRRLAILPQEPLLFSGTLRSNLDPFSQYDDARLNDALKRAYLISDDTAGHQTPASIPLGEGHDDGADTPKAKVSRISLDTVIEEEGGNLSVGQRSLVSLARALVKNSQIILLDEATASVDLETDAKIQQTIREEFANRTILCIAHRLRTILAYDRIAVFDQGLLAEYDSPLALFDRADGIFRGMCERSNITRDEVVRNAASRKQQ